MAGRTIGDARSEASARCNFMIENFGLSERFGGESFPLRAPRQFVLRRPGLPPGAPAAELVDEHGGGGGHVQRFNPAAAGNRDETGAGRLDVPGKPVLLVS